MYHRAMHSPPIQALLAAALAVAAPETPVPVDQEPRHRMVLRNDHVEVMRVTLPPGESTLLHTHSHDGVAVRLAPATITMDVPGEGLRGPLEMRPGDASVQSYARQPFTHRVNNVGPTPFDVLDVELLKRPEGPAVDALATPAAENDSARVYPWRLAPGAATPQHAHRRPYLVVAATPMQLLMQAPEGAFEHAVAAGDVRWVDDVPVTHVLVNRGEAAGVIVEIEVK